MLGKLPPWGQVAFVAVICALVVFMGYQYYPGFTKMQAKLDSGHAELQRLEAEIAKGVEAAKRRAELEKLIQQKDAELAGLRLILPTEPETGKLIKWLESQANRFNLSIKSVSEATIRQDEFFKEYTYAMDVVGNYHDLGRFFDVISHHDRIVNVRNVRITKNTGADARTHSIASSFSALTFVYTEKEG